MSKTITRRDILKFTGGGVIGLMLSPLPWKLLDDSAIWTQNWSLTPKLSHGPITSKFSHCTLCNSGCAVTAKCVDGMPYYLAGVKDHPVTHGTICPRGIASHHMAHHPLHIVHPHKFVGKSDNSKMVAVSLQEALDETAKQIKNAAGSIVILDQQPDRALSEIYRTFLAGLKNGIYLTSPSREVATIDALQEMINRPEASFGFDIENTELILSFGAPIFDGWGTPGKMSSIRNSKKVTTIQIESRYSRTAMQSDEWLAIRPGTEKILALSIANVLFQENLISKQVQHIVSDYNGYKSIALEFTPENTASQTGIDGETVRKLARQLSAANSAIVLSGADPGGGPFDHETEKVIASLNVVIGAIGKTGGIIARKQIPGYSASYNLNRWNEIPDHSIGILIVDGADSGYALPWSLIEKKLISNNNFVVSFSPVLNEISAHSDYLIPSPAHFESLIDVPTSTGNNITTFTISTPLLKKQEDTTEPIDVMKELSTRLDLSLEIPTLEDLIKQKVDAIHSEKRGTLFVYADQSTINITDISSADELRTKFNEGAAWVDEPTKQIPIKKIVFGFSPVDPVKAVTNELQLVAYGWRGATSTAQVSPILSKVFQETELRNVNGIVSVNPTTGLMLGLSKDNQAILSTKNGSMQVSVKFETSVRPGIIEASIAPLPNGAETPLHPNGATILNLCDVTSDGTWKITTANLLKV
jgi:anaerobic selenocysteine-containing dehydrogenase